MRVSFNWIRDYVDPGVPLDEAVRRLILIGFDVENIEESGGDTGMDVDVPSNRPDCLGMIGLARELAVALARSLRLPAAEPKGGGEDIAGRVAVQVDAPADCPRYTARLIRGVRVGPSPDWLQARLVAIGVTPVNNVVDVTNYVLFECGQPLHAFDASRLRGGRIVVRRGRAGEKMTAINGRAYETGPTVLVIADAERPVAVAGVMGGRDTEITAATTDVLLESAQFDPVVVRRASHRLGLDSDSSYRFERGVSREGVEWASRRAAALIEETSGGRACRGSIDEAAEVTPPRHVAFRPARCARVLGMPCGAAEARRIFAAIGCVVEAAAGDALSVRVPEHRRDLQGEEDLIEEVARLAGYDRIPTTPQLALVLTARDRQGAVEARIRERLTGLGYQEVCTPSFAEPATARDFRLDGALEPVVVLGKKGTPDRPLRAAVAGSLLDVLRTNERYGVSVPQAFELASVYARRPGGAIEERAGLGLAVRADFRTLRGHVEALAAALGLALRIEPWPRPPDPWPDGATARLLVDGAPTGAAAELTAAAARRRDLQRGVCLAEIDLAAWLPRASLDRPYREFPRLPEVVRDLAVVLDAGVPWDRVESAVRAAAPPWMERLEAFDEFRGAQVARGCKSLAFSMTFRRTDRTLTGSEVDAAVQGIVKRLEQDLGARLR